MKLPSMKRPSSPKVPDFEVPQFAADIYRDLRDRKLLPVVILLVVAIAAVPFALGRSSDEPPTPGTTSASSDGVATAAEAAVLAEVSGVRNFHSRLKQFKRKNPFVQQYQPLGITSGGVLEAALRDASTAVGSGGGSDVPTASKDSGTSNQVSGGGSGGTDGDTGGGESQVFALRAEVKVGEQGDLDERDNVKAMTFLPSDSKPVVAFLGASENAEKGIFLVSSDVGSTSGEGSCFGAGCAVLTLRLGESQTFEYTPDGKTYELRLTGLRLTRVG